MGLQTANITNNENKMELSLKNIYKGHYEVTYKGVPMLSCAFDYVIYQMLISKVKPDLIIEIGTNAGGQALYLSDLLKLCSKDRGNGLKLHSIDIEKPLEEARRLVAENPDIKLFNGGWEKYDILGETNGFKKIMVIDDGAHSYSQVLGALHKFREIVSVGSYYIVEDGILPQLPEAMGTDVCIPMGQFEGGPARAIDEFLHDENGGYGRYVCDRVWCDFWGPNATFNINGYLAKVENY